MSGSDPSPFDDTDSQSATAAAGSKYRSGWQEYRYLVWCAASYSGCLAAFTLMGLSSAEAWMFVAISAALVFATLQLGGVWAALGPGPYWKRSLAALAAGALVALGGTFGLLLANWLNPQGDLWSGVLIGLLQGPWMWVVLQIPWLGLRLFFGWHITRGDAPEINRFGIADILVFTSVAGLALAGLQMLRLVDGQPDVDGGELFRVAVFLAIPLVGFEVMFALPAVLLVLRSTDSSAGCARYLAYLGILAFVVLLPILSLLGPGASPLFGVAIAYFGAFSFFFCLPLMFSSERGFSLWTRRQTLDWLAEQEASGQHTTSGESQW